MWQFQRASLSVRHSWGPIPHAGTHLTVGCTNAGHLLVEFIQFCLELLQLLALRVHALVVLAGMEM